jgi:hypothetical protein
MAKFKCVAFSNNAGFRTARLQADFNGQRIEVGISDSNTTMQYFKAFGKTGDEAEIDDFEIQKSPEGRFFLRRISAEKFEQASKMRLAQVNLLVADKRIKEIDC